MIDHRNGPSGRFLWRDSGDPESTRIAKYNAALQQKGDKGAGDRRQDQITVNNQ
jgi:hypothetical protein